MKSSSIQNRFPRIHLILMFVAVIILIGLFGDIFCKYRLNSENGNGWIIYRQKKPQQIFPYRYVMMDGNGNNIQILGDFSGSVTWSPDGRYFAVGCSPKEKGFVCVFDRLKIPNHRQFPPRTQNDAHVSPSPEFRIRLPEDCTSQEKPEWEVQSISWSPDQTQLAVVCGELKAPRKVCMVALDPPEESYCWEDTFSEGLARVMWSPKENILAISSNAGKYMGLEGDASIYLVGSDGKNPQYLIDGWSPEWSSDGRQIAFFRFIQEGSGYSGKVGIAIIGRDGTGFHWVNNNSEMSGGGIYSGVWFYCNDYSISCRLAWSPDKRYLALSTNDWNSVILLRLDLRTGEIIKYPDINPLWNISIAVDTEPDWGGYGVPEFPFVP